MDRSPTSRALAVQQDCYRLLDSIAALRKAFEQLGRADRPRHDGLLAWAQDEQSQWQALYDTLVKTGRRIEEMHQALIRPYQEARTFPTDPPGEGGG